MKTASWSGGKLKRASRTRFSVQYLASRGKKTWRQQHKGGWASRTASRNWTPALIRRVVSNTRRNNRNAAYNARIGPDDPIRPPCEVTRGRCPKPGAYPATKRAVDEFPVQGWERLATFYKVEWFGDVNEAKEEWRGATNTFLPEQLKQLKDDVAAFQAIEKLDDVGQLQWEDFEAPVCTPASAYELTMMHAAVTSPLSKHFEDRSLLYPFTGV
ncbi:hypothetical protein BJ508DRAFT_307739 [Ascobolus immersus RN42]|uniref:Uncharacterized protein n=1 Tax=Ascobolus immersus RN42 TaxID=1160509 RepID=A0A3N4I7U9_ASCIM|nr:hypothetical protein BJ508DRAFT_307739 [Ascobolus immersus RN42]